VGVLPLALTRSRLFGHYGVSLPYVNGGSAASVAGNVSKALVEHAFGQVTEWGLSHIEVRDEQFHEDLPVRTDKVAMRLELAGLASITDLLNLLGSKVRAQSKKAMSSGIIFHVGGTRWLDDFYSVFSRNMRDLGTPVYSKALFGAILESFPQDASLVVGHYGQSPVSAAFLLRHGDNWEIPWASTLRKANNIAANMALYTRVLTEVIAHQGQQFDFGRSSIDSPTYRFKKQWQAIPHAQYWYYSDPTYSHALTTTTPKYAFAIRLWKKLPLTIANTLGPVIVRNLP